MEVRNAGEEVAKVQALKSLVHQADHVKPANEFNLRKTWLVFNIKHSGEYCLLSKSLQFCFLIQSGIWF